MVIAGSALALIALIDIKIDDAALLSAIDASIFDASVQSLLGQKNIRFTILSYMLIIFMFASAIYAFNKTTKRMGFAIVCYALVCGFTAWPSGSPFMLIVLWGAHWITLSELSAQDKEGDSDQQSTDGQRTDNDITHTVDDDSDGKKLKKSNFFKRLFY